jgi:plastocyanin
MRKGMWLAAASVALLALAPVLFIGPTVQAADTVTMGSASEQYALKFFPAEITVQVGSTVTWQNLSDLQHDAKADNGAFASKLLSKGEKFEFTFSAPGDYTYFCTPHKDAGMKGTIHVAGGAAGTPTTVASTTTTAPAGATTTATGATTTTTAKAAGASSTTSTTAAPTGGATTSTLAPAVTPTSAPEGAGGTTDSTAQAGAEQASAEDHPSEGAHKKKKEEKNSPVGIAFASVSTLLLVGIAGKLLASKP